MRLLKLALLGWSIGCASTASAATLFNVEGPSALNPLGVTGPAGLGLVFEVTSAISNADFEIDIECIGPCTGEAFLTRDSIRDGVSLVDLIAGYEITADGVQTAFSGIDLGAGRYSVVVVQRSGDFGWYGAEPATFSGDGSVSYRGNGAVTSFDSGFPPSSLWSDYPDYVPGLSITGTSSGGTPPPAPVPLPAGGWLLLGAVGYFAHRARRFPD